jgi:hypothetical protein
MTATLMTLIVQRAGSVKTPSEHDPGACQQAAALPLVAFEPGADLGDEVSHTTTLRLGSHTQ